MKKHTAVLIALAVGVAAIFGLVAATRTVHLGSASSKASTVPDAQLVARSRALDRMEIALRKELARKPPKLPPLPTAGSGTATAGPSVSAAPRAQAAQPQRVIYVRPAPIIRHVPRAGGHEDEHEGEYRADGSHEGGEFDD